MNTLRYFMPHVLALSTSSPFWLGVDTDLKSHRRAIQALPPTGLPRVQQLRRIPALEVLVEAGSIENSSKIYWDARPHHTYPTLEFRICDLCTNVDDTLCCGPVPGARAQALQDA